eukprot:6184174-Pleurochrysis_carterae.AAC.1
MTPASMSSLITNHRLRGCIIVKIVYETYDGAPPSFFSVHSAGSKGRSCFEDVISYYNNWQLIKFHVPKFGSWSH